MVVLALTLIVIVIGIVAVALVYGGLTLFVLRFAQDYTAPRNK